MRKKTEFQKVEEEIKNLDTDNAFIFSKWATKNGWKAVPGGPHIWTNGKDEVTIGQLRRVFNDYVATHKNKK